jgi:hypothetical protein
MLHGGGWRGFGLFGLHEVIDNSGEDLLHGGVDSRSDLDVAQGDDIPMFFGFEGAFIGHESDGAEWHFALFAVEAEINGFGAFGMEFGDDGSVVGSGPGNFAAELVVDFEVFEVFFDGGEEFFEEFEVPFDRELVGESFAEEVPASAEFFPGHEVIGVSGFGLSELEAGAECFVEEGAEGGCIDFGFFPDLNGDFLPGGLEVSYSDAGFAAVDGNFLHVIEGRETEFGVECGGIEGVFADTEAECEEPFTGGACMEEPGETFCGSDFDGSAVIPVGGAEIGGFGEEIDDVIEGFTVPVAGLSVVGESILGVPASSVGFPREFGGASQFLNAEVAAAFFREAGGIEDRDFAVLGLFEHRCEEFSGPGSWRQFGVGFFRAGGSLMFDGCFDGVFHDVFGGPLNDDLSAADTGFWSEVDDPVGSFDDIEVMFDDDDGISLFDEAIEDAEEFEDIVEVESGGGFVEQVECASAVGSAEFGGQFDALGFAAAECGCGLSESEVSESDGIEGGEWCADAGDVGEQFKGTADGHIEDVGDAAVIEADGECFGVEAFAAAGGAFDPDIREEVHFDLFLTHAFAVFAATARFVEAEAARFEAADAGFGHAAKEVANFVEESDVGCGVGSGSGPDGVLIDGDDSAEVFEAVEFAEGSGVLCGEAEFAGDGGCEGIHHQGAFPGAADAGDAGE